MYSTENRVVQNMIRIAVCDDDKNAITTIEELLLQLAEKGNIKVR